MGQPRDNKPLFMRILYLPIHPSLRGRELPRPTRSKHRFHNPTWGTTPHSRRRRVDDGPS